MSTIVGQTIGNYRIETLLGTGGMAQVYRAVHVMLNRPAAIKVMHANLAADPGFQERFVQEAKAAAALNHPNIVDIYDFSKQEQDGLLYLVMEYIANGSLRTLLKQQSSGAERLDLSLGLDLVRQAANGLAFAHSRGMVHRDIKPDNLLLADGGGQGGGAAYTVKISDFGLARLAEGGVATATGTMMGSPAYMSPEQCEGANLDGRSDLYSLGIVLYEVATGYLPFEIKTVSDAVYKHLSVPPLPPLQVRPDLPEGLDAIILRCLAKRPADRYATATELAAALTAILERLAPVSARPVPSPIAPVYTPAQPIPSAGAPPAAPRVTGRSALPRVHVLDGEGRPQNSLAITPRGLTVGRGADNVVVLADSLVSRNHLRLDWDGARVTATDLGAANGTFLGDRRLAPQTPTQWTADDWLRVGPFWLYLQPASSQERAGTSPLPVAAAPVLSPPPAPYVPPPPVYIPATQPLPVTAPLPEAPPAPYLPPSSSRQGRIHVAVEEGETLAITPGQPAVAQLRLANFGTTVDHFSVAVEGMPPGWVHGPEQEIQLNPNDAVPVILTVATYQSPEYVAGEYPVTIRARSRENPAESGEAHAFWTVLPYTASNLAIEPSLATSRIKAGYQLHLRNGGNAAGRYGFAGKDDESKINYRFVPETLDLDPGAEGIAHVTVRTRRKWLGRAQSRPFSIEALPTLGEPPHPVRGEWVQRAILPPWTPLVPVAVLMVLVALFFWLQPSIQIFIDPAAPVAGQPVTVRWKASHTNRIDLSVDGVDVAKDLDPKLPGKVFEKGLGGKSVEAVAKNRLGKSKAVSPLTVVQPTPLPTPVPETPVVDILEVDKAVVLPNEKVTLHWKVHNAEAVAITSNTGINDTGLKTEDTKEYTVTADTTFTVVAMNKGKETKQSVFAGTSAAVATSVSQTAVVTTRVAGTAAIVTAAVQTNVASSTSAVQTTVAGSTSAAQTTVAGSTAAAQTTGAGQNQATQTAGAVANIATQTTTAGNNVATQTTTANNNLGTQTAVAAGNLATQTSTANGTATAVNGTATAMARTQGTQTAQTTQTAVALGTTTAVAQTTATAQTKTQTAQAQLTATAQAKTTITVTEKDFAITMSTSTIQTGMITFKITNEGPSQHTFKVLQGTTVKTLTAIDAGKSVTTDPVDLKPGTYTVVCEIPGHEALGMKMTLIVIVV